MNIAKNNYGIMHRYALAGVALAAMMSFAPGARAEITSGILTVGPGETLVIGPGAERHHTGTIIVSGGRIEVNGGKLFLNGSMLIVQNGAVVFDAGKFHHEGNDTHVLVGGLQESAGDGLLAFRNGGRYHFAQTYVWQHELRARGNSRIELEGTKINCDQGTISITLFDNASYSATATETEPGSWVTWYMRQSSQLSLQGVRNGGDIVFYDAARIDVRNTIGVMPWLYFPAGAVADLSFPPASHCQPGDCPLVSKTIDATTVPGIDWSVNIQNSGLVMWGLNSFPGSSVTVRDSALTMAMVKLTGDHAYFVPGEFRNNSSYDDKTFTSVPDRLLHLVNTSAQWWKIDVIDSAQARIDNITFAEMMVMDSARALVTNSICEGQTIHLGATDNAYVYFQDGEVWTHVSAWNQALMVLDRSLVDYSKGRFPYQTRNIAHNRARLYTLNSELLSPPEATESALATFALLGTFAQRQLQTTASTWTPIVGSAWIAPWLIAQPGEYELRLTLLVSGDDPLTPHPTWAFPAMKKLVVQ